MVATLRFLTFSALLLFLTMPAAAQEDDPSPAAGAEVSVVAPTVETIMIEPGTSQTYDFEINVTCPAQSLHTQPVTVTVNATLDAGADAGVTSSVEPATMEFTFDPGACVAEAASQNETATLTVTVAADADGNVPITAGVEASAGESSDAATISALTGVAGDASAEPVQSTYQGIAGERYDVNVTLTNDANAALRFRLDPSPEVGELEHNVGLPAPTLVAAGESTEVTFTVQVPDDVGSRFDESYMYVWSAQLEDDESVVVAEGDGGFTLSARPDPATEEGPGVGMLPVLLVGLVLTALVGRRTR